MFKRIVDLIAVLSVAAFIGASIMAFLSPPLAPYQPTYQLQKQATSEQTEGEWRKFWRKTTEDPVAYFTFWLVILTAVLGLGAVTQFFFLMSADKTTKAAAEAATRSADIAERALIAGERAYVSVSFTHSAHRDITTGNIAFWGITPVWANSGNTPTRSMVNHISILLTEGTLEDDWDFPDLWDSRTPAHDRIAIPLSISPKASVNGQSVTIPVSDMDDVVSGRRKVYIWGWAAYNDVFPNTSRHVTRFAVKVKAGGDPRNPERMSFDFPYICRYNCSDEECERQGFSATWVPREMIT